MTWAIVAFSVTATLFVVLIGPRLLISRAQDRLANDVIAREGSAPKLLTRADLLVGRYRRVPGVLEWSGDVLEFHGIYGESSLLPMAQVQKIATGKRLSNGRILARQEALRLTQTSGEEEEYVLTPASAHAWRSHLGLWAGRERERENAAKAEQVVPGRR